MHEHADCSKHGRPTLNCCELHTPLLCFPVLSLTPELAATLKPCLSSAVFASIHKALTDPALAAIRQLIDKSVSTESKWHKYVVGANLACRGGANQV